MRITVTCSKVIGSDYRKFLGKEEEEAEEEEENEEEILAQGTWKTPKLENLSNLVKLFDVFK